MTGPFEWVAQVAAQPVRKIIFHFAPSQKNNHPVYVKEWASEDSSQNLVPAQTSTSRAKDRAFKNWGLPPSQKNITDMGMVN
jgi:hypothetical protein